MMRTKRSHLSDEEILLFMDRELSSRRHVRARRHLGDCPSCSIRRVELEGALVGFSQIQQETAGLLESNIVRSRSLLKARMAESAARGLAVGSVSWQLVCAGIALMIVAAGYWIMDGLHGKDRGGPSMEYQTLALPRTALTPGAVVPVALDALCRAHAVDNDPPVDAILRQAVFKEYGLSNSSRIAYELDYLITPALGGSGDIKNLWPQPYSSPWNARVKDQLEDHLHELVCGGQVQLTTAQKEIATDWISAYKRYFHTDRPQPDPTSLAAASVPDASRWGDGHSHRPGPIFHW